MDITTYHCLVDSFMRLYPNTESLKDSKGDIEQRHRIHNIELKRVDSFYDSSYGNTTFMSKFPMDLLKFRKFQIILIDVNKKDKCKLNILLNLTR